jgi:5'-nucleotidase
MSGRPHPLTNRDFESTLADRIADAQLAATAATDGGAQIAFMNPGGVRDDLVSARSPGRAGEI